MAARLPTLFQKRKTRQNISDYNIQKWRIERLTIAKRWHTMSLSSVDLEVKNQSTNFIQLPKYWYKYKAFLLASVYGHTKEETDLLNIVIKSYKLTSDKNEKVKLLLILGLFYYPHYLSHFHEIKLVTDFEAISNEALQLYIVFLLNYPQMLFASDEANDLQNYYEFIITRINNFINQTTNTEKKSHILKWCTTIFIGVNGTDRNLKKLYALRGKVIESYVKSQHPELPSLSHTFCLAEETTRKISIGLVITRIKPTPETSIWLSHFRSLDSKKFEKFIFIIPTSTQLDDEFERYFLSFFDHIVTLNCHNFYPLGTENARNLATKNCVTKIRSYNLDLISFTSVPSNYFLNFENTLTPYRLARKQFLTTATSPQTSGLSNIDYMISSPSMEPNDPDKHFTESLIMEKGSNHCFDYSGRNQNVAIEITKEALGIKEHQTVLINGSSMGKLSREVINLWLRVLKKVQDTVLILFPYNPLWTDRYSQRLFEEYLFKLCSDLRIDTNRVFILQPRKHYYEIDAILRIGDIYVDSFPFTGATSILDAFIAGLPTVIKCGTTQRTMQAAAMNIAINLTEQVCYTDEQYEERLIKLITTPSLRQDVQSKIKEALKNSAPFINIYEFNIRHEKILKKMLSN